MNEKTCFLIGNRHAPYNIKEQLEMVVEKHITEYGVNTFTVGHYGFFDNLARGVLQKAKKQHTNIALYSTVITLLRIVIISGTFAILSNTPKDEKKKD